MMMAFHQSSTLYLVLFLIVSDFFVQQVHAADDDTQWSYISQDKWPTICLAGRRQSPIPINTYDVLFDPSLTSPPRFINFNFNVNGTLSNPAGNRGVRWTVDLPDEDPKIPKVVGGGLVGDYYIRHIDFRWSASDCEGSDHFIDFKPYPLEVQLITFRTQKGNQDNGESDAIAVFSYLFQYVSSDNVQFGPVFAGVDKVSTIGSTIPFNITLTNVLPPLTSTPQYYRYNGSLPVPPCTESAVWTIFTAKQPISKAQMAIFRKALGAGTGAPTTAYRQLQQVLGRRIVTNVRTTSGNVVTGSGSGAGANKGGSGDSAASTSFDAATAVKLIAGAMLAIYTLAI